MSKTAIAFGVGSILLGVFLSFYVGPLSALASGIAGGGLLWYGIVAKDEDTKDDGFFNHLGQFRTATPLIDDEPSALTFVRCEVKPVQFTFRSHPPSFETAECGYVTFGNPPIAGEKVRLVRSIAAKITYADFSGNIFTLDGRWADTDQPAMLDPRQSTTHLLRVDFNVGDEHHLDIAAKFRDACFAINNDSFRGQIKDPARMLTGPLVKINIQLVAEEINQYFDFQLEIGGRFQLSPIGLT